MTKHIKEIRLKIIPETESPRRRYQQSWSFLSLPTSSNDLSTLHLSPNLLSYKRLHPYWRRTHLLSWSHWNFNTSFKTFSPNTITFWGSHIRIWGGHNSVCNWRCHSPGSIQCLLALDLFVPTVPVLLWRQMIRLHGCVHSFKKSMRSQKVLPPKYLAQWWVKVPRVLSCHHLNIDIKLKQHYWFKTCLRFPPSLCFHGSLLLTTHFYAVKILGGLLKTFIITLMFFLMRQHRCHQERSFKNTPNWFALLEALETFSSNCWLCKQRLHDGGQRQ